MADTINEGVALDVDDAPRTGLAPWHFWAVTAVALLWNGFGALDYTMTQLRNPAWIGQIPPETLATIEAAPIWATAAWALGVWGSFAGAVLMVLRSRHAVTAFMISLIAAAVSFAWQLSAGIVSTPIFPLVILAAIVFFWWYAAKMRGEGVLR